MDNLWRQHKGSFKGQKTLHNWCLTIIERLFKKRTRQLPLQQFFRFPLLLLPFFFFTMDHPQRFEMLLINNKSCGKKSSEWKKKCRSLADLRFYGSLYDDEIIMLYRNEKHFISMQNSSLIRKGSRELINLLCRNLIMHGARYLLSTGCEETLSHRFIYG